MAKDNILWAWLIAPIAAVMIAALPLAIHAQNDPPHVLIGTAMLNGTAPPTGTEIKAMDGEATVGAAMTMDGGSFSIKVNRPAGGAVTFLVAGIQADETLTNWMMGDRTRGFNLNATATSNVCPPPAIQAAGPTIATGVHSHEMPHIFIGRATLSGQAAAPNMEITAWDGATRIGLAQSAEGGRYVIQVARSYGPITFKIDGFPAAPSHPAWTMGQVTNGFNLTATTASHCLQGTVPASTLTNAVGGRIVRIFAFDNATKEWLFHDPEVAEFSDLQQLVPGKPYYILVSESFEIRLNGTNRRLTCSGGNCWNQLVW